MSDKVVVFTGPRSPLFKFTRSCCRLFNFLFLILMRPYVLQACVFTVQGPLQQQTELLSHYRILFHSMYLLDRLSSACVFFCCRLWQRNKSLAPVLQRVLLIFFLFFSACCQLGPVLFALDLFVVFAHPTLVPTDHSRRFPPSQLV